ncbi:MAG: hypothetical protein GY765_01825 [bacterium]|nr:hypothetical protein [bacterium]
MKWLEIIELRSTHEKGAKIDGCLKSHADAAGSGRTAVAMAVYRNRAVNTDWSIHLEYPPGV